MDITDLPIPAYLKAHYEKASIQSLYPPQVECISKGLFEGKNLLVSIPTASGKTLVAEMAMHQHIARGGKCLYIVPLKALASEKHEEFGKKGIKVGIATGDYDRRDEYLGNQDIIVATSEKVDSLIRNAAPWINAISLLVVDEVHLIDDPGRGVTLEMVITKLRYKNPKVQVIGLSATIGNPGSLAGWLDGSAVTSTWRPVDLREGVFWNGRIQFDGTTRKIEATTRFDDTNICLDTVHEGGQCLVFVSSRKNAEAFAKRMAAALKRDSKELTSIAIRIAAQAETEMGKTLAACIEKGAAFHHAGLKRDERSLVEEGFRNGHILCIASTPTLAAGLNLPARRVIIRDYLRFSAGEGMVPIPVREYRQMAGRAGRPRLDPYGEAVLIAKDGDRSDLLFECYINAPAEDVNSQCANEVALRTHILSLITSGFATTRDEILRFLEKTFYSHQHKNARLLPRILDNILVFLERVGMITCQGETTAPTEYGSLVSQLYLDPWGADLIVSNIRAGEEYSDIALIHLICVTPDMFRLYVSNRDSAYLEKFLISEGDKLWVDLTDDEECYFRGLKTAMLLSEWSSEVEEKILCERFSTGPGDIFAMVDVMNWLLHATVQLTRIFRPSFYPLVRDLELCMKYGVRRELLPLVRLPNIGRVRARRLYNNGLSTPEALKGAGLSRLSGILGSGVAGPLLEHLTKGERTFHARKDPSLEVSDDPGLSPIKKKRKGKKSASNDASLADF
jgi:helicase